VWPPDLADTVCPGPPLTLTFDRLTLKLVCESHLRWGTFLPNTSTLGLWVVELFAMYATNGLTDGRTDGRTKSTLNAPFPTVGGIINEHDDDDDDLCNSQHCSYIIIALDYARAACSPVCLSHVGVDSKLMTVGSCGLHYSIPF